MNFRWVTVMSLNFNKSASGQVETIWGRDTTPFSISPSLTVAVGQGQDSAITGRYVSMKCAAIQGMQA